MKETWRGLTRQLIAQHNEWGVGLVVLQKEGVEIDQDSEVVNVTSEHDLLKVRGKELSVARVRTYLWEKWRKTRTLNRRQAILWSVYNEQDDQSVVGVGAITEKRVAERWAPSA